RDPDLRAPAARRRRDRPARHRHPVRRRPRPQPPHAAADDRLGRPGRVPARRRLGDVRAQPAGGADPPAGMARAETGPAPPTPRRRRAPHRRRHRRGPDAGHVGPLQIADGGRAVTTVRPVDVDLLRQIEQFLFLEARLADEGDYDGWEALWTDDGVYWIPANGDDIDPTSQMSILFDNRSRIALRVRQLKHDKRHAQNPRSRLRRLLGNVELLDGDPADTEAGDVVVGANFVIYESRQRGTTIWAGRSEYRLRLVDGAWRMAGKKVMLVDNDRPLTTLGFLV